MTFYPKDYHILRGEGESGRLKMRHNAYANWDSKKMEYAPSEAQLHPALQIDSPSVHRIIDAVNQLQHEYTSGVVGLADGCLQVGQKIYNSDLRDKWKERFDDDESCFLRVDQNFQCSLDFSGPHNNCDANVTVYPIGPIREEHRRIFSRLFSKIDQSGLTVEDISDACSSLVRFGYREESIVEASALTPEQIQHILTSRAEAEEFATFIRKQFSKQEEDTYVVDVDRRFQALHRFFPYSLTIIKHSPAGSEATQLSVYSDLNKEPIMTFALSQ